MVISTLKFLMYTFWPIDSQYAITLNIFVNTFSNPSYFAIG